MTNFEANALSRDHKPECEDEEIRIIQSGGRVDSYRDEDNNNEPIGPKRVWLPDREMPGLAMSRSLGDSIAHSIGVSEVPEVFEFILGVEDKFAVVASDGVWEFLSNEEVCSIVLPFYEQNQPEAAANALVKQAHEKWK